MLQLPTPLYLVRWRTCWHVRTLPQASLGRANPAIKLNKMVVKLFVEADEVTAFCTEYEQQIKAGGPNLNPFNDDEFPGNPERPRGARTLAELTSMPGPILRDYMLDHDLPAPPNDPAASQPIPAVERELWRRWWDNAKLTASQRCVAWRPFDQVRLFEIVTVPPDMQHYSYEQNLGLARPGGERGEIL